MDRPLDVKRSRFVIPEIHIGDHLLDKIQSDIFDLFVKDSAPQSITFRFLLNVKPTIIDGTDDLTYLKERHTDFAKLVLRNEHDIERLVKYFVANPGWASYRKMALFDFGNGDSVSFPISISRKSSHELILVRK